MHPLIIEELNRQLIEDRLAQAQRVRAARRRYVSGHRFRRLLGFALIRWGSKLSATTGYSSASAGGRA